MKNLFALVLLAVVAVTLSACAGKAKQEPVKVKCPACGYEFTTPPHGR